MRTVVVLLLFTSTVVEAGPIGLADVRVLMSGSAGTFGPFLPSPGDKLGGFEVSHGDPIRLRSSRGGGAVQAGVNVKPLSLSEFTKAPFDPLGRASNGGAGARAGSAYSFRPEGDRLRVRLDWKVNGAGLGTDFYDEISGQHFLLNPVSGRSRTFKVDPSHRYSLELLVESNEDDRGTSSRGSIRASLRSYLAKPVPEPSTMLMLAGGLGLAGLRGLRRYRSSR